MSDRREVHDITPSLILHIVRSHYRVLGLVAVIAGTLTYLVMLCVPKYYRSDYQVAVEMHTSTVRSGIHAVGKNLGYDLGDVPTVTDGVLFDMYAFLFRSREFMAKVMQVQVTLEDGSCMSYYEYLKAHPQRSLWEEGEHWVNGLFAPDSTEDGAINPAQLTEEQDELFNIASKHFMCLPDVHKCMVRISVRDQDPMVCATLSDSLRAHILQFVMDYRLQKAQQSVAYYEELLAQSEKDYRQAMDYYDRYAAAHTGLTQPSASAKLSMLEREAIEKAKIVDAVRAQTFAEKARLQDKTPLFVPFEKAAIPVKPEGPKRGFNALIVAFLSLNAMILWYMRRDLIGQLTQ